MSKSIVFNNYNEFKRANCLDCPIRDERGCMSDPLTCSRGVELVKKQSVQGRLVQVGKFYVVPVNEGGEQ